MEFAILYAINEPSRGGCDHVRILTHQDTSAGIISSDYLSFLNSMGHRVNLNQHIGFTGTLDKQNLSGEILYYTRYDLEICCFVPTLSLCPQNSAKEAPQPQLLSLEPLLCHMNVLIIWNECQQKYRPGTALWESTYRLPCPLSSMILLIEPLENDLYCVQVCQSSFDTTLFGHRDAVSSENEKYLDECELFCARVLGPLQDGMVVNGSWLAPLIRATAINATRISRGYQRYQFSRGVKGAGVALGILPNDSNKTTQNGQKLLSGYEMKRECVLASLIEKHMYAKLPGEFYGSLFTDVRNGHAFENQFDGLSKSWKVVQSHEGFYTGGKVSLVHSFGLRDSAHERQQEDHSIIACLFHDDVAIVNASTGQLIRTLQRDVQDEERESLVVFAVRPFEKQVATSGRNFLLRLWDLDTYTCIRTIRAHNSAVLAMEFDPTGTLLATGGSDRSVRVFDINQAYCTHHFQQHCGIVTLVRFHPDPKRLHLFSCGDDNTVRMYDLFSQTQVACISEHISTPTCLSFSSDGYTLFSAGRDQIIHAWDLRNNVSIQTVVANEGVEGLVVLPSDFEWLNRRMKKSGIRSDSSAVGSVAPICFVTAGAHGMLRVWKQTNENGHFTSVACLVTVHSVRASSKLTYGAVCDKHSRRSDQSSHKLVIYFRTGQMNIKHLIFGLLPLQSYGRFDKAEADRTKKEFEKAIAGTGSVNFFDKVFNTIPNIYDGMQWIATFDLDGTLIDASIIDALLAYQLKINKYAFNKDDFGAVFGYEGVKDKECKPPKEVSVKREDGSSMRIDFEKIVANINKYFVPGGDYKEDIVQELFARWSYASYLHMKDKKNCNYLMTTIQYRLMYKMEMKVRKDLVKHMFASKKKASPEKDTIYTIGESNPQQFNFRTRMSKAFSEQVALIKALRAHNVEVHLNTASHCLYAHGANEELEIGIDPKNVHCSSPVGEKIAWNDPTIKEGEAGDEGMIQGTGRPNLSRNKAETINQLGKNKKQLIAGGDDWFGDSDMLLGTLKQGGFAVVFWPEIKKPILNENWKNLYLNLQDRVLIQYYDADGWIKGHSSSATAQEI
ncbi:hypothetical protein ABG067_002169 [Albugo candida]